MEIWTILLASKYTLDHAPSLYNVGLSDPSSSSKKMQISRYMCKVHSFDETILHYLIDTVETEIKKY